LSIKKRTSGWPGKAKRCIQSLPLPLPKKKRMDNKKKASGKRQRSITLNLRLARSTLPSMPEVRKVKMRKKNLHQKKMRNLWQPQKRLKQKQ
jgi:hypothetical protein